MKKLLITLTILVMSVLVLASCEGETQNPGGNGGNDDSVKECAHINLIEIPATNSTCSKVGYTSGLKCLDCEAITLAPAAKPLLAHREQDIAARPANCNTDGVTASKRCVMCLSFTVPATKVPMLNHVIDGESKVVPSDDVAATCTEAGTTGGTHCSVCFATVDKATIVSAPTGHDYNWTVDAEDETKEIGVCKVEGCGATLVRDVVVETPEGTPEETPAE